MKKALKTILSYILVLTLSAAFSQGVLAAGYSDVPDGAWYATYVSALSERGLAEGYADGSYRPQNGVKLGEALKLAALAADMGAQKPTGSHWASGYIALAAKAGYIGEDADPEAPANRLLAAQLTAKLLGLVPSVAESPFADCDDGYVTVLYECGVIDGLESSEGETVFAPDKTVTRAEMAAIIYRVLTNDIHEGKMQYGSYWVDVLEDVPVSAWAEAGALRKGIDVSYYQGDIDWEAVRADGVEFAILRLGYRGYGEGTLNLDVEFLDNIKGAAEAGVDVGIYFFSQAITVAEAVEEADFVLRYIRDYDITYPVCFDWEPIFNDAARTDGLDRRTLTDCAVAFCERIEAAGYAPMVYFTKWLGYTQYDLSRLADYELWFAEYTDAPGFYYDFDMWQCSSKGSVAGIEGNVDMNWSRFDYSA